MAIPRELKAAAVEPKTAELKDRAGQDAGQETLLRGMRCPSMPQETDSLKRVAGLSKLYLVLYHCIIDLEGRKEISFGQ